MNGEILVSTITDHRLNINKIGLNKSYVLKLDQTRPWIKELLNELHEEVNMKFVSPSSHGEISFDGEYYKKNKSQYGDYVIFKGKLFVRFNTNCVSTGKNMMDTIDIDISACFISSSLQNDESFKDEIDIYMDNDNHDLYFYEGHYIDLKEAFHEYIYLNKNPYPRIDSETSP